MMIEVHLFLQDLIVLLMSYTVIIIKFYFGVAAPFYPLLNNKWMMKFLCVFVFSFLYFKSLYFIPMVNDVELLLMCLLIILYSLSHEISIYDFCPFYNWIVYFLRTLHKDTNSFSVVWFASIFSQSSAYLFIIISGLITEHNFNFDEV